MTEPEEGVACAGCGQPARLQCPNCVKLKLAPEISSFCSQECFKSNWKTHKKVHKTAEEAAPQRIHGYPEGWLYAVRRGKSRSVSMPDWDWTGPLRPSPIGPPLTVPKGIWRPDYADHKDGYPESEVESKQQDVIEIRSQADLVNLRKACRLGREALDAAGRIIRPGITTDEIDKVVHDTIVAGGGYPSPLNYYNFPKSVCTSVNEVICHGIPDARVLEEGDIVNVDVTACIDSWHGDLNETFCVGNCDEQSKALVKAAYECLQKAINMVKPGTRYRDLGEVISKHAHSNGLSVVKSYCGHGIGNLFHCKPNVPHYAKNKAVGTMKPGQTFTIEPMINAGTWQDRLWPDGWTAVTADGKRSAQFEHTMVVTDNGVEVLTARLPTSPDVFPFNCT